MIRSASAALIYFSITTIAAATPLKENALFLGVRRALLQEKWQPVNVRSNRDTVMGVEHELIEKGIYEFESCSIDFSNCILHYRKKDNCLTVYTKGEQLRTMRVVAWTNACPSTRKNSP